MIVTIRLPRNSGRAATCAAAHMFAPLLIPAMKERGYSKEFAAAVTSSSASLAIIIPPSIPMILYAAMAQESAVKLFIAGIIPGVLGGLGLMALCYYYAWKHNFPVEQKFQLARLGQADLFLDTLLINAHTGASDALWAGLPVLTCPQQAFPSRVAASVVCAAGLPDLACRDLAEYEEKAVELAVRPDRLRDMRRHLEGGHARLPLFDTARFARNLERAYETMWQRWLAGEAPRPFDVVEPPLEGGYAARPSIQRS